MSEPLWANYGDSLKLILTGSSEGKLGPEQRKVFTKMLTLGIRDESGQKLEKRHLPGLQTKEYCIDEADQKYETYYYIPDLFRKMVAVYGPSSIHSLPVNLDYLNSLNDNSGNVLFSMGSAPVHQEWLDSPGGKAYWNLLCRKIEIRHELDDLKTTHHNGKPSEKESQTRQRDALNEQLDEVNARLGEMDSFDDSALSKSNISLPEMPWIQYARKMGKKFVAEYPRLNLEQIANKVYKDMVNNEIKGRGGRVPTASTIKRRALTGIKS